MFQLTTQGLELIEIAPGIDIDTQVLTPIPFAVIMRKPKLMNSRLHNPKSMGLAQLLGANVVDGCVVGRHTNSNAAMPASRAGCRITMIQKLSRRRSRAAAW